ncbi:unnamed protein product [Calicophoron daubneyi]|uniref:Glycosyltransferase family 92 protein n=1 Tax=Calicophoron daubneyi TaxID=300641 RepID=A0AAV2TGE8_CALDB
MPAIRIKRNGLKKVGGILSFIVVLTLIFRPQRQIHEETPNRIAYKDSSKPPNTNAPITLAFCVRGKSGLEQFGVLIKNIFYHQGRFQSSDSECTIQIQTISNKGCPVLPTHEPNPLNLHILADRDAKEGIRQIFTNWRPPDINLLFYNFEDYKKEIHSYALESDGIAAVTMNLLWPETLNPPVDKVILLETDILFNREVSILWDIFDEFNDDQMIGAVSEETDDLRQWVEGSDFPPSKNRINSGMILLHMERIRKSNWTGLWTESTRAMKGRSRELITDDESVFDQINMRHPAYFFKIPCEWNYVIFGRPRPLDCPLTWIVHYFDREDCITAVPYIAKRLRLAGMIHYRQGPNQELLANKKYQSSRPVVHARIFNAMELQSTFLEVYQNFLRLEFECFP